LRRACILVGIPNECLTHLPRTPLVYLTHLFNRSLRLAYFPKSCKEAKVITLPKRGKDSKLPQNLRPFSLLSIDDKLFENVILKLVQRHIEVGGLPGFRARQHDTSMYETCGPRHLRLKQ
jgi:hypothetical protein